jgi:phosphate transport system substrate-binding protein
MKHLIAPILGLALLGLCQSSANAQLTARGSDSTLHVLKALAAGFEKETGKSLKLEGGGSGAGAKAVLAGEVQIAFLSRALSASEKEAGLVGIAYAVDGVAVIAHRDNPQADLTVADLKDLFTGTAATWKDGKPAVLFNRNSDSGTREVFQEVVLGKEGKFSDKAAVKHDGLLVSSVAKIPSALAYLSLAEVDETVVKVLSVNGIKPSPESLRNKTYPISRTPTLATKGEPSGDGKAFIDFVLGPKGQAIVEEQKLVRIK